MKVFLSVVIISMLLFIIFNWTIKSDEKEIKKWASSKGLVVESIHIHLTIIGTPFYYVNKGSHIYEAQMINGDKWWIRMGLFSNDYEQNK